MLKISSRNSIGRMLARLARRCGFDSYREDQFNASEATVVRAAAF